MAKSYLRVEESLEYVRDIFGHLQNIVFVFLVVNGNPMGILSCGERLSVQPMIGVEKKVRT
jgi:hypothetical protein